MYKSNVQMELAPSHLYIIKLVGCPPWAFRLDPPLGLSIGPWALPLCEGFSMCYVYHCHKRACCASPGSLRSLGVRTASAPPPPPLKHRRPFCTCNFPLRARLGPIPLRVLLGSIPLRTLFHSLKGPFGPHALKSTFGPHPFKGPCGPNS